MGFVEPWLNIDSTAAIKGGATASGSTVVYVLNFNSNPKNSTNFFNSPVLITYNNVMIYLEFMLPKLNSVQIILYRYCQIP